MTIHQQGLSPACVHIGEGLSRYIWEMRLRCGEFFTKIKSVNNWRLVVRRINYLYCQAGTVLPCAGMFTTENAEACGASVREMINEIYPAGHYNHITTAWEATEI